MKPRLRLGLGAELLIVTGLTLGRGCTKGSVIPRKRKAVMKASPFQWAELEEIPEISGVLSLETGH